MQNFQDSFETRKRSFFSAVSICMTVPLIMFQREAKRAVLGIPEIQQKQPLKGVARNGFS